MDLKKAYISGGEVIEFEAGDSIIDILKCEKDIKEPLIAIVDGEEVVDLSKRMHCDANIKPIGMERSLGAKAYLRTLTFVLIKAVKNIYPKSRVILKHSLNKGLYGEIENIGEITDEKIEEIKSKMFEIINRDIEIEKIRVKKGEAEKIFKEYGMKDKLRLLSHLDLSYISLYKCGSFYDYFYGTMLSSTGYLTLYDLFKYGKGFILMSPKQKTDYKLPKFVDVPKLAKVFDETQAIANILDVADVGALNDKVDSGEIKDLILVSEALHEKKIGSIADKICENKDKIKLVAIAGPSSSGKTTFSKRLSIQLRLLGFDPYTISLDDYFVDREHTPRDEDGQYDFESIGALDVKLFNEHLSILLDGGEISLPKFDFLTGNRIDSGKRFRLKEDTIIVIEGIHGLNEVLTESVPRDNKFKIYISALTQLNIDDHNRMPTTDVRLLRRIVRDHETRGRNAETTILGWSSVRRGEEKNIFPYQEEADAMFNSTVIYEMSILRKYVQPLLEAIPKENPAYIEAKRLLDVISYFKVAPEANIPPNSIIKEFIGGGCFEH
ncbi:nucleoside kinase [Clostridium cylindrosporum]|uniref:Phosphoribulokinase/uridine kinase n=1 Tax=Clostridium cylindrosporum DSM 605 TaxID=1121307 RepID=A0A0J8D3V0_CLOCY|nr:nucleoside kinase [Clostridium cylindrosporum]KMT20845.1 phosphoribulokinase/uridine kinase [Clostridium cylindrosporum DSM 605]